MARRRNAGGSVVAAYTGGSVGANNSITAANAEISEATCKDGSVGAAYEDGSAGAVYKDDSIETVYQDGAAYEDGFVGAVYEDDSPCVQTKTLAAAKALPERQLRAAGAPLPHPVCSNDGKVRWSGLGLGGNPQSSEPSVVPCVLGRLHRR